MEKKDSWDVLEDVNLKKKRNAVIDKTSKAHIKIKEKCQTA